MMMYGFFYDIGGKLKRMPSSNMLLDSGLERYVDKSKLNGVYVIITVYIYNRNTSIYFVFTLLN